MISEHISLHEATQSPTALRLGIINEPNEETLTRMKLVSEMCFEPLRKWYGKPIKINSFYRSPDLNKAVGGATGSQHVLGEAMDITGANKEENKKIFDWLKANVIFDQLINEYDYSWVHVSFKLGHNRNMTVIVK